jgi:chemotaxis protein MotB
MKTDRETPVRIVRKGRRAKEHHGAAWKVAFADFTTSMMSLFLVLWLVTQSSDIKAAVAGYFQDPLGRAHEFGSSFIEGQGTKAANVRPLSEQQLMDLTRDRLQQLGERIRRQLELSPRWRQLADQIEITVTEEGLRIDLLEDSSGTFFETGRAVPRQAGVELLHLLGGELATLPYPVVIEGHADARPYWGNGYSNWELSADRANVARRMLVEGGLRSEQIAHIRGYADHDLKVPSDPLSPRNRRVTITMLAASAPGSESVAPRAGGPDGP